MTTRASTTYVAPMLFGDGFEKTMKGHVDAMRRIRKTSNGSRTTESSFWRICVPKVEATKRPKLDRVVRGSVSKDTKYADNTLVKLQTLMLDAGEAKDGSKGPKQRPADARRR